MRSVKIGILTGLTWGILSLGQPVILLSEGVKTHYKEYTIFTHGNLDYLCEPYEIQKDDWLYKIFRKKGEISASDFPKFLNIFRKLNPKLSNIDAIAPGIQVMIPLKQVDKDEYTQKDKGIVEVPVLEFSLEFSKKEVEAFIRGHEVKKGDTVSGLLGKEFLKKGGTVSEIGKQTFTSLNPQINDINRIYIGAHVLVPEPEILYQPWLATLIAQGLPDTGLAENLAPNNQEARDEAKPPQSMPILSAGDMGRLKRYAQLIQGTLMNEGKVFFPGKKGEPAQILDLSKTPVLKEISGQKTLVLPANTPALDIDQDLVSAMKAYWKGIRLQELNKALSGTVKRQKDGMDQPSRSIESLIKTLVSITPFSYTAQGNLPVTLKNIKMMISLGRITHDQRNDVLVNTGKVYGQALDFLAQQGYEILNLPVGLTIGETTQRLFSKLEYETWKNPSFYAKGRVQSIQGIYVNKGTEKHFITRVTPSEDALSFLNAEGIFILILDGDTN